MPNIKEITESISLRQVVILLATLGTIIGSVLTVDTRYAHSDDLKSAQTLYAQGVETQRKEIAAQTQILRKQLLEDKVFELDLRRESDPSRRLSPVEEAQYKRYTRQIEEIARNVRP